MNEYNDLKTELSIIASKCGYDRSDIDKWLARWAEDADYQAFLCHQGSVKLLAWYISDYSASSSDIKGVGKSELCNILANEILSTPYGRVIRDIDSIDWPKLKVAIQGFISSRKRIN